MKPLQKLEEGFNRKSFSDVTRKRWKRYAQDFLQWLKKQNIKFSQADSEAIKQYMSYKKRKLSGNSMKTLYYILKELYKLWDKKWSLDKADIPKGQMEPHRPFFNIDETKKIRDTAVKMYNKKQDFVRLRNLALVMVGSETGSRRIQIHRLNRESYQGQRKLYIPSSYKGGRGTTRILSKKCVKILKKYMDVSKRRIENCTENTPLFIGLSNNRLSPEAMNGALNKIKDKAGVDKPKAGFHAFRRGKTTRLHNAGLSEMEINRVMGWKEGSRQSHTYAQLDEEQVQKKAYQADELLEEEE